MDNNISPIHILIISFKLNQLNLNKYEIKQLTKVVLITYIFSLGYMAQYTIEQIKSSKPERSVLTPSSSCISSAFIKNLKRKYSHF